MNSYSKTALAAAICTALSAGHAGAATFNVTNTNDTGAGSLRDALSQAGANAEADVIDLSTVSGQTISISSGQLEIDGDEITINGADATLDAGGNSRVLAVYYSDVTLNDLTITGGVQQGIQPLRGIGPAGAGGGIYSVEGNLEINGSEISGNTSDAGGGLFFYSEYGSLGVNDSVVSGNNATYAGGGVYADTKYGDITFSGASVTSNTAGAEGGGINVFSFDGSVSLVDSIVSNNAATGSLVVPDGARTDRRAELEAAREARGHGSWATRGDGPGGSPGYAGGAGMYTQDGAVEIIRSTISGNSADFGGGLVANGNNGVLLVDSSTISGNSATDFGGAGVLQAKYDLQVRNSTISGNTSGGLNGGLVVYSDVSDGPQQPGRGTPTRTIAMEFTTITNNSAGDIGGLGISTDIAFPITASVISGNTAPIDPDIGFNPASFQQADLEFSLVGVDSTTGTLNFDATSTTLLGQAPQIGPLAGNGGPTFSHLPAGTSPLVDVLAPGAAGCGGVVATDQRGQPRPQNGACDLGSIERGVSGPAVAVPVLDRFGLLLMAGLLGLAGFFGFRRRASHNN